jgi:hypothetical protein
MSAPAAAVIEVASDDARRSEKKGNAPRAPFVAPAATVVEAVHARFATALAHARNTATAPRGGSCRAGSPRDSPRSATRPSARRQSVARTRALHALRSIISVASGRHMCRACACWYSKAVGRSSNRARARTRVRVRVRGSWIVRSWAWIVDRAIVGVDRGVVDRPSIAGCASSTF